MEHLTPQQLDHLKTLLNQREQILRTDIQREMLLQESHAQTVSESPDPGDSPHAHLSVDVGNAAVRRDMVELRAIETARKRMDSGRYGECMECGYEIPYERLRAQPTAERCAPCQGLFEKSRLDGLRGAFSL